MARPIAATPVLTGREAAKFLALVHENARIPVPLTPTPKLQTAHDLVKKHAKHQKHLR
jgi:hypothetical protein